MKAKHAAALAVFLLVWAVIDLPLYVAKRLGLPVKELGE